MSEGSGIGFTSYSIDNDRIFRDALELSRKRLGDLRIPLTLISRDFYRSQKAIWKLKSEGQYPDLAESTKADKQRHGYPVYPALMRSGKLRDAASTPTAAGSINRIVHQDTLYVGVDDAVIPYAGFHQDGTRRMPMRKYLFIGPEARKFATVDQVGRLERWVDILAAYVVEACGPIGASA